MNKVVFSSQQLTIMQGRFKKKKVRVSVCGAHTEIYSDVLSRVKLGSSRAQDA